MTNYQRQIPIFIEDLKALLKKEWKVLFVVPRASEEEELKGILKEYDIPLSEELMPSAVHLIHGVLSEGYEMAEDKLAVLTAGDVLGKQKIRRVRGAGRGRQIRYFSDLNVGDYVVQDVHGIGKYLGIKTIELSGVHRDYIAIQYAGNDKLYLPVEKISTLEKYIGPEGGTPVLSKMGEAHWEKSGPKPESPLKNWRSSCWIFTPSGKSPKALPLPKTAWNRGNLKTPSPLWKRKTSSPPSTVSRRPWSGLFLWTCSSAATWASAKRKWPCGQSSNAL